MSDFENWIYDDITWCSQECSYTACERNVVNRLTKGGLYSSADFKDTPMCPQYKPKPVVFKCLICGAEQESTDIGMFVCDECKEAIRWAKTQVKKNIGEKNE